MLGRYAAWASWRWAPCVSEHLQASAQAGVRPYTVQYRETDLAIDFCEDVPPLPDAVEKNRCTDTRAA